MLKIIATQVGGNGYIKYYWEKHGDRKSEKVLKGYSENGNPYYGTRTTEVKWFTGYATAVLVEPNKK